MGNLFHQSNQINQIEQKRRIRSTLESVLIMVLMLYPMRHIYWGIDFWDTGYNYANFQYMGMEHMDPMWLFSTYLANVVGNFLTKLPQGGTLAGMNLYTGLFVSVLVLLGYLFCTRKLRIPMGIAFLGEMVAISLCWCPTALLYNYLTYVLFLACVILLYIGLSQEKMWYLFGAGVCLGTNILVRFSNLPEAAMIVAVWAYAFIVGRKEKRAWKLGFRHTLWCLGGYLGALAVLFGYIHIRYGLPEYITGIQRLFAMTDNATDYKATSMLRGMVYEYVVNMYWVIRIVFFVVVGMVVCAAAEFLKRHCAGVKENPALQKLLTWGSRICCGALAVVMLCWLYLRGFCSQEFYGYGAMLRPGVLFLMLTMLIAVIRIFHRKSSNEERLISGMLLLVVLLTSIGSNNGVYPSMNNLFVAAPYTLWQCWRFIRNAQAWEWKKLVLHPLPAKCVLTAFLAMFLYQVTMFGVEFVFAEGTGVQNITATVTDNEVLAGIQMNPQRAQWIQEINDYVKEKDLQGKEIIPFGDIPAMSYYLQMPAAFNPWCDLDSYSIEQMQKDMQELSEEIELRGSERPVILVEKTYAIYQEGGRAALEAIELAEPRIQKVEQNQKWLLLVDFMEQHGYQQTFVNDKFVMWE